MSEPEITQRDGFYVTFEQSEDGWWVITAVEDGTEEVLLQFIAEDEAEARTLRENVEGADLSDLR